MKCVAVSDFHLRDVETPPADLLIVGGDMTNRGNATEIEWFKKWLVRQPQKHKVWIAGNHDMAFERDITLGDQIAKETGSTYLNDSATEVEGVRIWGSPVTPDFFNWAFMEPRGVSIRRHWELIPDGLDILITHGPPYGYLDATMHGEHVGCEDLYDVIANKLTKPPRYHIFGHIHEGFGRARLVVPNRGTIELINASICDTNYRAVNPLSIFEL